jgi:hypothetical protein
MLYAISLICHIHQRKYLLNSSIPKFQRLYPELTVDLLPTDVIIDLYAEKKLISSEGLDFLQNQHWLTVLLANSQSPFLHCSLKINILKTSKKKYNK